MIQIGDEQIYRQRDQDPSQRVRVISIGTSKRNPRYEIEFLDGERTGKRENVPERRLRGPWSGVRQYDENVANWQRIAAFELTDIEESAVTHVFEALIPEEVAHPHWDDYVTEITDPVTLEMLIGSPVADLVARVESRTGEDGTEFVSPEGTLMIAEPACTVNPMPILALVVEEQQEYRETTKRGSTIANSRGDEWTISPERMYSSYLEHVRPRHELQRGWCGHRKRRRRPPRHHGCSAWWKIVVSRRHRDRCRSRHQNSPSAIRRWSTEQLRDVHHVIGRP